MAGGRREKIIRELLATEETYVNCMTWLIENFQQPLLMGGIITAAQDDLIFLNAASILELHKPLLAKLKTIIQLTGDKDMDQICIGNIMLDLVPWIRLYTTYINNHQQGAELIDVLVKTDDNFRYALNGCCAEGFTGVLGISSLRLVPVQRVPRYVLLLKDLLQNTLEDHIDYGPIKAALDAFSKIAEEINEKKREYENLAKLQKFDAEIKVSRGLLLTDSPYVVNHQWSKVRVTSAITCALPECKKVLVFGKKYHRCSVCNQTCHQVCTQEMAPYCNQPVTLLKHDRFLIKDALLKSVRVRMNSGKKTGDSAKPAQILLFTDLLAVLFPIDKSEYDLSAVIRWYSVSTNRKVFVQNSASDALALVVTSPTDGDVHTFICDSTEDRDDWVTKITQLSEDWFVAFEHLTKPVQSQKSGLFSVPQSVRAPGPKGKLFTSFVIQVNLQYNTTYTVLKQLTDLDKFHKGLRHAFPKAHIPPFPKRMDGDNSDLPAVQSRCQRLEAYFNELAQIPDFLSNPVVKEFLQPDGTSSLSVSVGNLPPAPQSHPNVSLEAPAAIPAISIPNEISDEPPERRLTKSLTENNVTITSSPKPLGRTIEGRGRSRAIEARPEQGKFFRAIVVRNYTPVGENEIALNEGSQVTILTTTSDNRYLVYFAGVSGYVPQDVIELKSC